MIITVGIDVGQRVDPTAISVTEQVWRPSPKDLPGLKDWEDHYIVRHLERLPLGTTYPLIVRRLANIVEQVEDIVRAGNLRNRAGNLVPEDAAHVKVYMDATGVGKPVVDMMAQAGVKVVGTYFTHGDRRTVVQDEQTGELRVTLGKAYMVARLQALLQTFRLHLPRTDEALALTQELVDFEIKVDQNANDKYGAFRVGAHDDLVTALGLTVQEIPVYLGATASDPGHNAFPMPEWAGGRVVNANDPLGVKTTIRDLERYGGLGPRNVIFGKLAPWDPNDYEQRDHRR